MPHGPRVAHGAHVVRKSLAVGASEKEPKSLTESHRSTQAGRIPPDGASGDADAVDGAPANVLDPGLG